MKIRSKYHDDKEVEIRAEFLPAEDSAIVKIIARIDDIQQVYITKDIDFGIDQAVKFVIEDYEVANALPPSDLFMFVVKNKAEISYNYDQGYWRVVTNSTKEGEIYRDKNLRCAITKAIRG